MAETFLDKYCRDLTVAAKEHPQAFMALERDQEVAMAVEILLRKTKNSPVLVGEAGVGKTSIVEELARRIALDQVPRDLRHKHILVLQTADLVGANPNDFMVNFNGVLHELQATLGTNILFVDEIHELIGTGAASDGSHLDAGNVLKPALARGEIQLIGATTNDEYHVSIEQDRALQRRFSMIPVLEPSRTAAIQIINGVVDQYAQYHDVTYAPDAVITAVDLSIRYRPDYFLPDKAFDLIDAAGAVEARKDADDPNARVVTRTDIAEALKDMTGIPVTTILKGQQSRVKDLEGALRQRVKGQNEAVHDVAQAVRIATVGLQDETKPLASFMFLGSSGVGKTELSKALAETMFDDERNMIRLDMSEYKAADAERKLIGDRAHQGLLTEAVKRRPYSVVLVDEMEKGNQSVHDLFLQILDDGVLHDGQGREVSFKNTIVIMTTNVGAKLIKTRRDIQDPNLDDDRREAQFHTQIMTELEFGFEPGFRHEFLNRIGEIIIFNSLEAPVIRQIADAKLTQLGQSLAERQVQLEWHQEIDGQPSVLDYLALFGTDPDNGARPLDRLIKKKITGPIAQWLLKENSLRGQWRLVISVTGAAASDDELSAKRQLTFTVFKDQHEQEESA